MLSPELKNILESNNINYTNIKHAKAIRSQDVAEITHVKGKHIAKTVMVKLDGRLAMAVTSAPTRIDTASLKQLSGSKKVEIASENDFRETFPNCEVGAMPPFGNIYGLDVYVSNELTTDDWIAFNGGTHTDLVKMSYKDFDTIVHPYTGNFTEN